MTILLSDYRTWFGYTAELKINAFSGTHRGEQGTFDIQQSLFENQSPALNRQHGTH